MDETHNNKVFFLLSVGSNLGDRINNIKKAIEMISGMVNTEVLRISSFYETEPFGYKEQPWFINIAVSGYTSLSIMEFYYHCKSIEQAIGRKPRPKWHEREIDIDILFFGNQLIDSLVLQIPHKGIPERRFVLVTAAEIHPDFVHPLLHKTISQLLEDCLDNSVVKAYSVM
ncbi:MAG: 2-amino-4-hydroxy-6-hydroxymethyldihydropteridine diphosphokinase [Candidatus Kapaibacteriales bacterium]